MSQRSRLADRTHTDSTRRHQDPRLSITRSRLKLSNADATWGGDDLTWRSPLRYRKLGAAASQRCHTWAKVSADSSILLVTSMPPGCWRTSKMNSGSSP